MSDPRSFLQKMQDDLVPSLFSGAIGVAGAHFLMGVDLSNNISVFNISLPSYVAIGGTIALSDALAYASHDFILENIPSIQSIATYENRLLAPVLSGLATYGLFRLGVSENASILNSVVLGAGSTIAGKYLYNSYNMGQMDNGQVPAPTSQASK
jgi:hypothetical protein